MQNSVRSMLTLHPSLVLLHLKGVPVDASVVEIAHEQYVLSADLIDRKVKLVDLFKTMELVNNRYAFYMLGRGSAVSSVNAFCIVTNSANETPVYPIEVL